jgi:heme/copper-type cytochrome/quinol oxidase subunit 2
MAPAHAEKERAMNSNLTRVVLGVIAVAAAVVLLIVLKGSDSEDPATDAAPGTTRNARPLLPVIAIENGEPVGGVRDLTYEKGDRIRFEVKSDVSDEIHVHGYDVMKDVEAGGSVSFDIPATIEGVFEVELERRGEQIAELTVNP